MKKSILLKTSLCLITVMVFAGCKDVNQQKISVDSGGRKLQVELRMPEPWKHIIIGPSQQKEYPKIPSRFSTFMSGKTAGTIGTLSSECFI